MEAEVQTEQPVAAPAEDVSASLADHEAQFGPGAKAAPIAKPTNGEPVESESPETERDDRGQFVKRRAASHQATAKDVDDISAYTKRFYEALKEAGVSIEKKQGESDRAFALRRNAEIAEALREAKKSAPKPAQSVPPATVAPRQDVDTQPATPKLAPFTEPAPRPEAFGNEADPAEAYYRAIAAHEFRKQIHEAQQALVVQRTQESQREAIAAAETRRAALNVKITEFEKTAPDFWARMDEVEDLKFPDLMGEAIARDVDNAPRLMYHLATHPDDLVDAIGYAASFADDFSDSSVALVRRRLSRYLKSSQVLGAGETPTGASAPAPSVTVAPRPPTPVRTGPLKTGDEPPGDDDSSISSHEKHFGPKRR